MRRLRETWGDRLYAAAQGAILSAERGLWRVVLFFRLRRDPGLCHTCRSAWRAAGRMA